MFGRVSISTRIAAVIVVSQALLYGGFALLIMRGSDQAVDAGEKEAFRLLSDTIRWSIDEELNGAALSAATLAANETLLGLLAAGGPGRLADYLRPTYDRIRDRVVGFHVYRADGSLFLRLEDPSPAGPATPGSRPMIDAALRLRTMVSGIERDGDGVALRLAAPLFLKGEFIGLLEYGMEFGPAFMRTLKDRHEGEYYLFLLDKDGTARMIAGTRGTELCALAGDPDASRTSLVHLIRGDPVWSLDCSQARAVGMYPFKDYSGEVAGFIKAELGRIPLSDAVAGVRIRLTTLGILMILSLGLSLGIALRTFLYPLRAVVAQTKTISRKIIAGDVAYRGDITETAPDFREIIGAVHDIINALRERGTLLLAIVEGIPGIVYYVDADYQVLWANGLAKQRVPTLVGMNLRLADSGFFEHERELLQDAFARGAVQTVEACYFKDGVSQECWEHVAVPVQKGHNGSDSVIRISHDITDKHRAETELRILNETLERRVEEEIRRRKEGERIADQQSRLAAIGELATGMAHEITQPLNAVSFSVENIRSRFGSGVLDAGYLKTKIAAIDSDIDRVRRVIEHVRLFARGAPDGYRVSFQANRCVENAMALIGVQLATHGIDVALALADGLPDMNGNPFQYEQVLLNLLSNARDAVEERKVRDAEADLSDPLPGRIRISTSLAVDQVLLEVEDNGIGIPPGIEDRVFDPFFTTKAPGKGTGLGLSLSYGIIREMGGRILLERRPAGAAARVLVPVESKA